tara:strand:+ start:695 stop:961 length:267 start_codon:yes stop_codon:yes gene_type:complete
MNKPEYTQKDVDSIVRRAKELGAEEGCTHKSGHLKLAIYAKPNTAAALATLIINGWHGKYDLIYATQALIEYLERTTPTPNAEKTTES